MRTETEISYEMVDATAAADATPTATSKQSWVDLGELHDETEGRTAGKWATCEVDEFLLDGTFSLFPDDPAAENMGLWSQEQSGADGAFTAPPVLTVTFSQAHTSIGITLTFSEPTGDWCSNVGIAWYDASGTLLKQQDFTPDAATFFCDCLVENYYKVVITFRKTNKPHRFLKLFQVQYGLVENLQGKRITAASLLEETDPTSMTVSVNTFRFAFHADRNFDLLNLANVYAVFQQQQRVHVRQRVDGVVRKMGLFYTDAPEVEDQRAVTIDCIDQIGVLDQTDYMGGLWLGGITAGALLTDIMQSAGMAGEYEIDVALAGVIVKGYLPICTHRQALQQLAFALGAMVSCARRDSLRVCPAPSVASATITPRDKAVGHRQTQRSFVSGVEIYTHNYTLSSNTTELFKATCKVGAETVKFSTPAASLSCSGATITESGVNYAKLKVTTAGTVTLTGTTYEDQVNLGGSVYVTNMPAGGKANVKTVEDCTLSADPQAVAQRLYDYYQQRVEDTGDLFLVTAAAGDLVELQTAGGRTLTGIVESMDIDLYNGGIGKAVIAGG